jgi:hypothetical protein
MHDAAESSTARCCQKREFWHQPLVFRSPFTKLNLFLMWVVGIAWSTPRPTTTADRACVRLAAVALLACATRRTSAFV